MYSVLHFQTPKKCHPYTYHNIDVLQYEQIDLAEKTTNILAIVGPKEIPITIQSIYIYMTLLKLYIPQTLRRTLLTLQSV